MNVKNIKTELQQASFDVKAGIKLIKLTGDKNTSVYAAEIPASTTLNPHYHERGIEIYQILEGEGIMQIGDMQNGKVNWNTKLEVKQGDCFSIYESKIHQIGNVSEKPLIAVFTCPESHLGDDRFFI
jgi:mannose-6-phosphate isomerase-like protein (cupin superfamily)